MMTRITIMLSPDEREALHTLAQRELRDTRKQAALMLHLDLERLGLLPSEEPRQPANIRPCLEVQK
jgi:hypothetical protein